MTTNANSVRSSDAEVANRLVAKLTRRTKVPPSKEGESCFQYVDLSPARVRERERAWHQTRNRCTTTFEAWESLLAWAIDICEARTGFVVNSEGFVIATWGENSDENYDGIGADLCLAIDQLERMSPDGGTLRSLHLEFDSQWLIGLRATSGPVVPYTIGLICQHPTWDRTGEVLAAAANSLPLMP
jgi:hypothetical protein